MEAKRLEAIERGKRELAEALAREQVEADKRFGIVESPSVERFKRLNLDDAPASKPEGWDVPDASIERFKRLDLD